MASSKAYLDFILDQLSDLEGISYRAMMGEYIIYYKGKIVGGIYDDRLLVKPVKSAVLLMPDAKYEKPYEGAKEMLMADNVDDKEFLSKLFIAMYPDLPEPKKKDR
ncbi:MAG: TfoX/Sxy family protein [Clostridia bacterium]|nr:TfoX/Sxy family protein [Clostridia bacterium]